MWISTYILKQISKQNHKRGWNFGSPPRIFYFLFFFFHQGFFKRKAKFSFRENDCNVKVIGTFKIQCFLFSGDTLASLSLLFLVILIALPERQVGVNIAAVSLLLHSLTRSEHVLDTVPSKGKRRESMSSLLCIRETSVPSHCPGTGGIGE